MSETLLALQNLRRTFGGLAAVDDVTVSIGAGELVGLIGPNGAGKTTLFNLISGFTVPSSGSVSFAGHTVTGWKGHRIARLGLGRTFQNLRIFPTMTVFDNVAVGALGVLPPRLWGGARRAAEVENRTWKALAQTGLTEQAQASASSLSYGQRKYLEIARALAGQPRLLILDEPAAGLNDTETADLARFIQSLYEQGITVLLVEHDMSLVMNLCRRILVLASGRLIADDTPAVIRRDPVVLEAYLGGDDDA